LWEILFAFILGTRFLLLDSMRNFPDLNRMVVFASDDGFQRLETFTHWACDGTFDIAPLGFTQLYCIHLIVSVRFKFESR
jgi:hypothetical protein